MSTPPIDAGQPFSPAPPIPETASFKFQAFNALARIYAADIQAKKDRLSAFLHREPLTQKQAVDWLFAQSLFDEGDATLKQTLEHVRFGAIGWILLSRESDGKGAFSYALRMFLTDKQKLEMEIPVCSECVGRAVLAGQSLLAAALAEHPDFARDCSAKLLDGNGQARVNAEVDKIAIAEFIADVEAPTGTPRRGRL